MGPIYPESAPGGRGVAQTVFTADSTPRPDLTARRVFPVAAPGTGTPWEAYSQNLHRLKPASGMPRRDSG